jgi:S-adenosylmethionine:tRNA ribosyltransferase-isomerase
MNPKDININDFTYQLSEERIARYPLPERDSSKLLTYQQGRITESNYKNIQNLLPENSFLFFNDTKVIEARILFQKPTGGIIEIFCLEPHEKYTDITNAMLQNGNVLWKCLIGGASKWKKEQLLEKKIEFGKSFIFLRANYIEKINNYFIIEFTWAPEELSFAEMLHYAGLIPLPPYIKREAEKSDTERYQTIYAVHHGSVAAPTAGLHFTDSIFKKLAERNIAWGFITLHVGAGTFQPVKAQKLEEHFMHGEFIEVSVEIIETLIKNIDRTIISVGTTSLRTIESLFWLGAKIILQPEIKNESLIVNQWDAYELPAKNISVSESLQALLQWLHQRQTSKFITKTHLLIAPGYPFKIIKALITNFHQPQSTLLLLVAALIGEDWKNVYQYAMKNDFRFLSYGDGCLLFQNQK